MLPSSSNTSKTLNPRAPEYFPIPPGINPYQHAQLPFFFTSSSSLPPSCTASSHQLYLSPTSIAAIPPVILSTGIFSYLPSHQPAFHNMYANYYVAPPIPNGIDPLQPPAGAVVEAPPLLSVVTSTNQPATSFAANVQSREDVVNPRMARIRQPSRHFGQPRTRGFGGFLAGRGRGCFGRNNSWNRIERRHENNNNNVNCRYSLPKEDNRHKVLPLKHDEENTTVMVKNIPYDCPRKDLIEFLDRFCAKYLKNESTSRLGHEELDIASYDFLYLPIDFKTKKGRGFAFINFTNAGAVWKFFNAFNLKEWDSVKWNKWPKKMEISRAKIQGKEALISHFSNSRFECGTDEFLPVCFNPPRDGSGQPVQMTAVGERRPNISHWEPRSNHKV